jgi:hypothetical protein
LAVLFVPGFLRGPAIALGADALQQYRRGFVLRVLRHKLAGEGFFQDRLTESICSLKLVVNISNLAIRLEKYFIKQSNNFFLFRQEAEWKWVILELLAVNIRLINAVRLDCITVLPRDT